MIASELEQSDHSLRTVSLQILLLGSRTGTKGTLLIVAENLQCLCQGERVVLRLKIHDRKVQILIPLIQKKAFLFLSLISNSTKSKRMRIICIGQFKQILQSCFILVLSSPEGWIALGKGVNDELVFDVASFHHYLIPEVTRPSQSSNSSHPRSSYNYPLQIVNVYLLIYVLKMSFHYFIPSEIQIFGFVTSGSFGIALEQSPIAIRNNDFMPL